MIVMSLDTETSGLPGSGVQKGTDDFPWAVQVGALLLNESGVELDVFGSRIRANGRKMQPGAIAVHGITDFEAGRAGISEIAALSVVCGFAAQAHYLVGYGISLDRDVCESALVRLNKDPRMLVRPGLQLIELRDAATHVCRIPSDHESGSYKWPSLGKACEVVLGDPPRGDKHVALDDARRAARLFKALADRGLLDIPPMKGLS